MDPYRGEPWTDHRAYAVPAQPPLDRWFSSERAIGIAAAVLIVAVTLISALTAVSDWHSFRVLRAYEAGPIRDAGQLQRADLISGSLWVVSSIVLMAAAMVFLIWLWRVRWNAEMFCQGSHRHTRGWVIGAWICPLVNLWWPKQVIDDVLAASDCRTPARIDSLRAVPHSALVRAWWIAGLTGFLLDNATNRRALIDDSSIGAILVNAVLSTGSALATAVAAVLVIMIIERVNSLQTERPWQPWWSTPAPAPQAPPGLPHYGPPGQSGVQPSF
ncbi:DUF4328 domain-containing protein [Kribbella sp. NBC_01245]|uniref:DUF4328 domain-containing protein n=1 Tax=Kribbella sp. NBC_01245 TaxID=2903578 RepID=UPI002E29FBFB|nr:DUF4328 domain-containing protein [Kribbella sp. NBC_01245]